MDFLGVILLIVLIFPGTLHGIFLNFYNRNYPGEEADATHVYSSFLGLIVAFVSFAIDGFSFNFSIGVMPNPARKSRPRRSSAALPISSA